jgi:hypothetical protein
MCTNRVLEMNFETSYFVRLWSNFGAMHHIVKYEQIQIFILTIESGKQSGLPTAAEALSS